ncbi:MAG: DNA-binding protein [Arthrobacter sp.]|jgi:predicted DNA-binding protein with PD1-like motif|nr:DNA-binding protein [Arthrobacter sp.]
MQPTGQHPTTAPTVRGATWSARHIGGPNHVVSVNTGEELIAALTDFAISQGISGGAIRGIGAVGRATLLFRDPDALTYVDREFDEQMEIAGLQGNIARKGEETLIHIHTTLGRQDYSAIAGHLKEAWIRGAGEFFVTVAEAPLEKQLDPELGLNILTL